MATKTPRKKVIARFYGKGFYLKDKKVGQKSMISYVDKDAYLDSGGQDYINEFIVPFIPAIGNLLENKRIDPRSIRISFHILEK